MTIQRFFTLMTLVAALGAATPVLAHHSANAEFDTQKQMTITGVLTKLEVVNPHSWWEIDVKGPDGKVTSWRLESNSPAGLIRLGVKVKSEVKYLAQPLRATFERPYGWAWLLMFAAELDRHDTQKGKRWSDAVSPLADAFTERFLTFLPKATYPTRVGTHFNSAFAITLALEYAEVVGDRTLRKALVKTARAWYLSDSDCQAWEPGGDDFLSSALMEAECMRRVLSASDFSSWLDRFLPRLAVREPTTLFTPAVVSDRSDGKIAHLVGLNLSRAWCWRSIATAWSTSDARRGIALKAADTHLAASLPHVAGDYMGEHWLATFALLALL